MYHPTSRVLAVLELMQSHRRMTGAELAKRLEVNIRTLRRYITTLQDIGIPIHTERGRYGAYTLGVGFRLPPLMFSNDEALALEIGLLAADQLLQVGTNAAIQSARAKIEHVLPYEIRQQVRTLQHSIQLDLRLHEADTSAQLMLDISAAVQHQCQICIHYRASDQETSERTISPYAIACLRGLWYLVGWCHLRQAMRSFRIDRILSLETTSNRFHPLEEFNALTYLTRSLATIERPITFEVLLKTDLISAKAALFDLFGVLEPHANGVLLHGTADDVDWVARQLAALPFAFVIHQPPELPAALRQHAAQLVALAGN